MAKVYVRMIRAGRMILQQVPERWREEVNELLRTGMIGRFEYEMDSESGAAKIRYTFDPLF